MTFSKKLLISQVIQGERIGSENYSSLLLISQVIRGERIGSENYSSLFLLANIDIACSQECW
jgi:hypothetical protein